jgi:hypothetical protein
VSTLYWLSVLYLAGATACGLYILRKMTYEAWRDTINPASYGTHKLYRFCVVVMSIFWPALVGAVAIGLALRNKDPSFWDDEPPEGGEGAT